MPTVQAPVQLSVEHLLAAVKRLSPTDLREFTRQFGQWQAYNSVEATQGVAAVGLPSVDHRPPGDGFEAKPSQPPRPGHQEMALIQATQARLPKADAQRLKQLSAKSESGTLKERELEEYRTLAHQAEQLNVKRVEALAELVRLKGKPVHLVMEEIGWEGPAFGA